MVMRLAVEERMYSVAEVAGLLSLAPRRIRALIAVGKLAATRLTTPDGGVGSWRVYPGAIRSYLGLASPVVSSRRAESEYASAMVRCCPGGRPASRRLPEPVRP